MSKSFHYLTLDNVIQWLQYGDVFRIEMDSLSDIVIQQYTGLKDKNNKEIYEGDIIKTIYHTLDCDPKLLVVGWDVTDAMFTPETEIRNIKFIKEVIGNIFENPELLK